MDFDCDDDDELLKVLEELDNQNDDSNVPCEPEPRPEHLQCLQNVFGHSEFRPMQWKVIRSIIEDKRDNCCIMATGYGKSLLFQFCPVFTNGISFIISPLISLMQDQVNSLNLMNIPACLLGTAQTNKSIENDIINGNHYRIIYASPEYIGTDWGSSLIGKLKDKLTLIAVDEAHCISSWGPDFRPKFLELANVRNIAPNVPILAVTATATDQVQKDICTILKLRNPQIICTGFDRPNLEISVKEKTREPWDDIGLILRSKLLAEASCIIYCLTRKQTDSICDELKFRGLKCGAYHAGKTINQRKETFDKFTRDEINIIVATVAFGMGIDKSDVRCVIHYGSPPDMDSYYQEIGRAGRDGVQSKCILFHSAGDFEVHRALRMKSRLSEAQMHRADDRAKVMKDFIYTKQCRRLKILQYFDGPKKTCPKLDICCDNCRLGVAKIEPTNKEIDFTKDAKLLLQAIGLFGGNSGITKPIAVVRGAKLKAIERFHSHKLMGTGTHRSEQFWKVFADSLERQGMLQKHQGLVQKHQGSGFGFSMVRLTRQGQDWVASDKPLIFAPSEQLVHLMISEKTLSQTSSSLTKPLYNTSLPSSSHQHGTLYITQTSNKPNEELKRSLMVLRAMIASKEGTMPYKIASEPAIDRLAKLQPLNLQELRDAKIDGFSETLMKQFGPEFIECIVRSKGLLSPSNMENLQASPKPPMEKMNQTEIQSAISSKKIEKILPTQHQSDNQNMFEDDDELFMNVDYEISVAPKSITPAPMAEKKVVPITAALSKRVKYENSSSDEDTCSAEKLNKADHRSTSVQSSAKPIIGIRKRNNIF